MCCGQWLRVSSAFHTLGHRTRASAKSPFRLLSASPGRNADAALRSVGAIDRYADARLSGVSQVLTERAARSPQDCSTRRPCHPIRGQSSPLGLYAFVEQLERTWRGARTLLPPLSADLWATCWPLVRYFDNVRRITVVHRHVLGCPQIVGVVALVELIKN